MPISYHSDAGFLSSCYVTRRMGQPPPNAQHLPKEFPPKKEATLRHDHVRAFIAFVALAAIATPGAVCAQTLMRPTTSGLFLPPPDSVADPDARLWQRYISATVVGAVGAVTLGTIAAQVGGRCNGGCSDIEGLAETILGVFIGATVGSAIGAALPRGRGLCTGGGRFGRGMAGAGLGLLAGIGFFLVPPLEPAFIVTIPVGSVMFMRKC